MLVNSDAHRFPRGLYQQQQQSDDDGHDSHRAAEEDPHTTAVAESDDLERVKVLQILCEGGFDFMPLPPTPRQRLWREGPMKKFLPTGRQGTCQVCFEKPVFF
jgi:hypothetical protein